MVRYTLKISMATTPEYRLLVCESEYLPPPNASITVADGWASVDSYSVFISPATNNAEVQVRYGVAGDRDAYDRLYRDCRAEGWQDWEVTHD